MRSIPWQTTWWLDNLLGAMRALGDSRVAVLAKANASYKETKVRDSAEQTLIRKVIGGDDDAFFQLVSQHKLNVARLVSRFVNQVVDRDEIVSDTFAEVYFSLSKFRGDSKLSTWISTIATRLCLQYLKKKDKERKRRSLLQRIGWPDGVSEHRDDRDRDSARAKLESLMEVLSAEDRVILTLLYWEECSVAEVAKRLNWSESKIKVRAHRAREKMRQHAKGHDE